MSGKEYRTITDVKGPLVFLNKTEPVAFGEIVTLPAMIWSLYKCLKAPPESTVKQVSVSWVMYSGCQSARI